MSFGGRDSYEQEIWCSFLSSLNRTTKYPNLNDKIDKALILWFANVNKSNYQKEWHFDLVMLKCFALAESLNSTDFAKMVWKKIDQIIAHCRESKLKNSCFTAVFNFLLFKSLDSRILHKLKELKTEATFKEVAEDRLETYLILWNSRSIRRRLNNKYYRGRKRMKRKWRREKLNKRRGGG